MAGERKHSLIRKRIQATHETYQPPEPDLWRSNRKKLSDKNQGEIVACHVIFFETALLKSVKYGVWKRWKLVFGLWGTFGNVCSGDGNLSSG